MDEIAKALFDAEIDLETIGAVMASMLWVKDLKDDQQQMFIKKYGVMSWLEIQDLVK